jgi:hypothetical protein
LGKQKAEIPGGHGRHGTDGKNGTDGIADAAADFAVMGEVHKFFGAFSGKC